MTHEELRKIAISTLKRSRWNNADRATRRVGFGCSIVLSELTSVAGDVPDAIGWQYGHSILIECKTSRADFFADQKKPQRLTGTGAGERRYYMTPTGLVQPEELPEGWGLLWVEGKMVAEIADAPRRNLDGAGHLGEKAMLLSTIRRIRTREFLVIVPEAGDLIEADI